MPLCDRCQDNVPRFRRLGTGKYPSGTRCDRCPSVYKIVRHPRIANNCWTWVMPPADQTLRHIVEDPS